MTLRDIKTIDDLIEVGRRIEDFHWRAKQYCPPPQNSNLFHEPELSYQRSTSSKPVLTTMPTTWAFSRPVPTPKKSWLSSLQCPRLLKQKLNTRYSRVRETDQ